MPTFKCPHCGGIVDVKAEVCPHCQCEVPESIRGGVFVSSNTPAAKEHRRGMHIAQILALIIVGVPTLLIIWGIRSCVSSVQEAANKPYVPDASSALYMCRDFAEKQLKAPSTADFASLSDSRVNQLDTNTFEVISWVDAQNSFGAKLRTGFTCTVTYVGNDRWQLKKLKFDEQ